VGAIALVLFVVIVLPIVFDKEPRPITQDLAVEIPSQDSSRFSPRMLPQAAPTPQAPAQAITESSTGSQNPKQETAPAVKPTQTRPDPAKPEANDDKAPAKAESSRKSALKSNDKEAGTESFVVPLGAFSNPQNAKQVQSKVAAAGFKSYSESVKGARGAQTRVRAGPFATRDAAERAREKLKSLGLNPVGAVAPRES
jgi:DedD protein